VKTKRPRADFMLSREVLEAAAACGNYTDAAASKAMRNAKTRVLLRAEQYRRVMLQKARPANEAPASNSADEPPTASSGGSPLTSNQETSS
jgi:hypothetical protein